MGRRSPADGYCWKCCAGRSAGSGGGGLRSHTGCCASVWRRRYSGVLKLRPHVLHTTGCASWISRTCWRRLDALLYRRPHCAQRMPPAPAAPTPPAPPATPCPPAANNTRFALRHSAHSASRLPPRLILARASSTVRYVTWSYRTELLVIKSLKTSAVQVT